MPVISPVLGGEGVLAIYRDGSIRVALGRLVRLAPEELLVGILGRATDRGAKGGITLWTRALVEEVEVMLAVVYQDRVNVIFAHALISLEKRIIAGQRNLTIVVLSQPADTSYTAPCGPQVRGSSLVCPAREALQDSACAAHPAATHAAPQK